MTHSALVTVDAESLGAVELAQPNWPPGSIIYADSGEPDLRVVGRLEPPDDDPESSTCVVEPVV